MVGLDIGSSSVKAVELTREGRGVAVTGFAQVAVPPSGDRRRAVGEVFRTGGFHTKRVVASVSGKSLIIRYITLPRMAPEEVERTLRLDLDRHLPLPPEERQFDWKILGEAPGGSEGKDAKIRVVLVGARRSRVFDLASMLVEVGLVPVSIDADVFALGNAFALSTRFAPLRDAADGAVGLVDVGASKTCIHVVAGGASQFAREAPYAGNELNEAISRRLAVDPVEAESRKRDPLDRAEEIREAVGPVLDDLANEVALSCDYYEQAAGKTVGSLYLCGGSALGAFLAESLEATLERKTKVWNPVEGFPMRVGEFDRAALEAAGPSLAIAVGLAAKGTGVLGSREP